MPQKNPEPPPGSRAERIAYNEAWSRTLNERQAEAATKTRDLMPGFRCECWRTDCAERIPLSGREWKMVRAETNRFAVAPGHVAESFEAVVMTYPQLLVSREVRRGSGVH